MAQNKGASNSSESYLTAGFGEQRSFISPYPTPPNAGHIPWKAWIPLARGRPLFDWPALIRGMSRVASGLGH